MALPGANPADALKQISTELQEKFDEAGMGEVEDFVDKLDDLVDKIKKGPAELVKSAEKQFSELKDKLEKVANDPGSVAPSGGAMAMCAAQYGKAVVSKLGDVASSAEAVGADMAKLATNVVTPLKSVGDKLDGALQKMEDSVKSLAKLPKLVSKEIQGKDSPDDVGKINTAPMKKALSGGDLDGPLNIIMSLAGDLTNVVELIGRAVSVLEEFIGTAPSKIKSAFDPPFPFCCLSGLQPEALKDLLNMIEQLGKIDLTPVIDTLRKASEKIGGINVDMIKTPVNAFLESAKDLVDKLDKTVQAAKLSSGGGLGKLAPGGMI
jgi:hypothetical protein